MKTIFLAAALAVALPLPVSIAPAVAQNVPVCDQNPGDRYNPVTRQCDRAPARAAICTGTVYTDVQWNGLWHVAANHIATGQTRCADSVLAAFLADCASHDGRVYTAAEWNALGMAPTLHSGQLQCHRAATWAVNP